MLVLTRSLKERIVILTPSGDEIVVGLNASFRDKASIGITAPVSFKVYREELYEKIKKIGELPRGDSQ